MAVLSRVVLLSTIGFIAMQPMVVIAADADASLPKAFIDGTGLGWQPLAESDFVPDNAAKDTWVANSKMTPFPFKSSKGERSFPRKYYADCEPHSGYLCLESEGAPVEFKELRIRELP